MEDSCFTPTLLRIDPGDTITWVNRDGYPHTVTGANVSWGDYSELTVGQSVSHTFRAPGTYAYYCLLHPGMIGAVVVGDGSGSDAAGAVVSSGGQGPAQGEAAAASPTPEPGDGAPVRALAIASGLSAVFAAAAAAVGYALGKRRNGGAAAG